MKTTNDESLPIRRLLFGYHLDLGGRCRCELVGHIREVGWNGGAHWCHNSDVGCQKGVDDNGIM